MIALVGVLSGGGQGGRSSGAGEGGKWENKGREALSQVSDPLN